MTSTRRRRLFWCRVVSILSVSLLLYTIIQCMINFTQNLPLPERESQVFIDDSVASEMKKRVRVMCWIPSTEKQLHEKVKLVNDTWVPRCNGHIFFINVHSTSNVTSDVIGLDIRESYYNLSNKSYAAFTYLYKHHLHDYDWFLKGDDDAYIIMENLRFLLSHYDPSTPVYLGHLYKKFHKAGYMSGGAGYVLSREALRLLYEKGISQKKCLTHGPEDVNVGRCLHAAGVASHASRDKFGRDVFHPLKPEVHIVGPIPADQIPQDRFTMVSGPECCGQLMISFHKVEPELLRIMDHLLYRTSVYGRQPRLQALRSLMEPGTVPPLP